MNLDLSIQNNLRQSLDHISIISYRQPLSIAQKSQHPLARVSTFSSSARVLIRWVIESTALSHLALHFA